VAVQFTLLSRALELTSWLDLAACIGVFVVLLLCAQRVIVSLDGNEEFEMVFQTSRRRDLMLPMLFICRSFFKQAAIDDHLGARSQTLLLGTASICIVDPDSAKLRAR